jgi:hypothetical protein
MNYRAGKAGGFSFERLEGHYRNRYRGSLSLPDFDCDADSDTDPERFGAGHADHFRFRKTYRLFIAQ